MYACMHISYVHADGSGRDDEGSQSTEDDEKLLEEYYLKFKGPSEDKKYHLIPKFYSKVSTQPSHTAS